MDQIVISEYFKRAIGDFIKNSESKNAESLLRQLIESGWVDDEFGHLIFSEEDYSGYNPKADLAVLDAIEDEIKRQLLTKYNE